MMSSREFHLALLHKTTRGRWSHARWQRGPTDLEELTQINSDESSQREHCLRNNEEAEPGGTKAAVDDCRAYILQMLTSSLDGLDATGTPDPTQRESFEVGLTVRGEINVNFPIFYIRVGQAMHAIEDSFTHDWRDTNDPHKITVTLNWIAYADNAINEPVTGPAHSSELDRCDDPDALRTERRQLATEAASQALITALDPRLSRDQKIQGFQNVLDTYVVFDQAENCTYSNGWCNAPERSYAASTCGCRLVGTAQKKDSGMFFLLGGIGVLAVARRRRLRFAALLGGMFALFSTTRARADDAVDAGPPPPATPGGSAVAEIAPPVRKQPVPETSSGSGPLQALAGESASAQKGVQDKAGAIFLAGAVGASYDHEALVGRIGGRYALSRYWMAGLDVEWNPYLALGQSHFRSGSLNTYLSLIRRFQLAYEAINLRSRVSVGGSVLLFDLVGAPGGSIGPFVSVSLLGLEVKLQKGFYLTIDPTEIAIPVPHVTGIPFVYYQYRFMVGIEFGG